MDLVIEILVCLSMVVAFLVLMWPERIYKPTPLEQRREPTIDRHKAKRRAQQVKREL